MIKSVRACMIEVGWWIHDRSLNSTTKVEKVEKLEGRSVLVISISKKGTRLRASYRWNEEVGHVLNVEDK